VCFGVYVFTAHAFYKGAKNEHLSLLSILQLGHLFDTLSRARPLHLPTWKGEQRPAGNLG
jgi:hypothetical protein